MRALETHTSGFRVLGNESPVEKTSLDQLQWSQDQDAREWLLVLWRQKWLILLLLAGVFIPALLYTSSATPLYTAQTQLLFESNQGGSGFELGGGGEHINISDELSIASEMQVVLSRGLASRVVGELGLTEDPEFNPDLRVAGPLEGFWKTVHPLAIVAAVRRWLKPEEGDVSGCIRRDNLRSDRRRRIS